MWDFSEATGEAALNYKDLVFRFASPNGCGVALYLLWQSEVTSFTIWRQRKIGGRVAMLDAPTLLRQITSDVSEDEIQLRRRRI